MKIKILFAINFIGMFGSMWAVFIGLAHWDHVLWICALLLAYANYFFANHWWEQM